MAALRADKVLLLWGNVTPALATLPHFAAPAILPANRAILISAGLVSIPLNTPIAYTLLVLGAHLSFSTTRTPLYQIPVYEIQFYPVGAIVQIKRETRVIIGVAAR